MILVGNQRGGAKNLALHLLKSENERVDVHQIRGFVSDDLRSAFQESYAMSRATKCKQHLFSLSLNPPHEANLSAQDFEDTVDRAEKQLGLEGQPRAIVLHTKNGRTHAHAVWSRIVQKDGKIYAVGGKFGELAQLSDKVLGKEQERFDAAVRRVATHQGSMVKLMDAKLVCKDTQADAPLRSDLRNWLKALGPNKAKHEAVKAATEGNLSVIHTVLTAPTQLTGLTQADLDTVRTEARKKLAPDLFQSHQQTEAILATMINASKAIGQKRASVDVYRLKDESDANAALGKLGSMARA